jgi:hypothetical protein
LRAQALLKLDFPEGGTPLTHLSRLEFGDDRYTANLLLYRIDADGFDRHHAPVRRLVGTGKLAASGYSDSAEATRMTTGATLQLDAKTDQGTRRASSAL